ncbi:MAG: DUF5916 domain-containing protein [Vicinamibacterales bacterium]
MSSLRSLVFLLIIWSAAASTVAAQSSTPAPIAALPVVNGVPINGPAPPIAPETLARDSQGRVTLRATRVTTPMKIDGRLDEEPYRLITSMSGFVQTEPRRGELATEQTEMWLFYDDENIYVGAKCYDSTSEDRWVANEMRRDSMNVVRNENFAIYFDTFYDRRNAFLFELSPIGGIYDATVTNERGPGNTDYNPVWERQAGRFEQGWIVEMAIPFRALRYRSGASQVWGVNVRRTVRWKNEESFIQRMPPNQGSVIFQISLGGTLVGIDAPSGSKNLELKPYAITGVSSDRLSKPPVDKDLARDAGFDLKYGLTQNLTADFTYNTDFAQVEVDEQQVNLTRFPLFFPEKREFFLEGQGIFDFGGAESSTRSGNTLTPLLFFSRRIGLNNGAEVPIDAGGRLTGKVGKTTIGIVDVRAGDSAATPATNFGVVRVKQDIMRRSNIGALFTGRSSGVSGPSGSQAYGVDASIGLYDNWTISSYYAQSRSAGVTGDGTSYRMQAVYNGDRYGVQYEKLFVGDRFNPEVGFLRRAAFDRDFASFRFSPRPARSKRVRKYAYSGSYDYITNPSNRLESREVSATFGITFQNSDAFSANIGRNYDYLATPFTIGPGVKLPVGGYGFGDVTAAWTLGVQRKVSGTLTAASGSFYDGHRNTLSYTSSRIELSPRLSLEPSVSLNWVDLLEGQFTTRLLSNRMTFTVTPLMFFSGLLQYNSSTNALSTNLRLRWEYHRGSELFVVYTDERDTALTGVPDLKNRAFVVKINRLFQF